MAALLELSPPHPEERTQCASRRMGGLALRDALLRNAPEAGLALSHCICRIPFPPLSSLVIPECLANAPPPGFRGAGRAFLANCAPERVRVARDAGSGWTHGPRCVAAPRRSGKCRKSAVSVSVPRAVFEACSVRPPVVGLFQDPSRCEARFLGALTTALGPSMRPARWRGVTIALPRVPLLRSCRYGISRLGPPGRGVRSAPLISHSRATAPDPQRLTRPRPSRGSRRSHDKSARRGRG